MMKATVATLAGLVLATTSVSAAATVSNGDYAFLGIKNAIFGIDGLNQDGEDIWMVLAKTIDATGFNSALTEEPLVPVVDVDVDGEDDDEDNNDNYDEEESSEASEAYATESSFSGGSCAAVICGDGMADRPNKDSLECVMDYMHTSGNFEYIVTPHSSSCRNCCIPDQCVDYDCDTETAVPYSSEDPITYCKDYSCPFGLVPRENSDDLICAQTQSNSADCVNCCVEPSNPEIYLCSDFTCPYGFESRTDGDFICTSTFFESSSTCMNCCVVNDSEICC